MEGLEQDNIIELSDLASKLVHQGFSKTTNYTLDIKRKDKGIYFYCIINTVTKKKLFRAG